MINMWLELLKTSMIVKIQSKLNRMQTLGMSNLSGLSNHNTQLFETQIDIETRLFVQFPFSPYIEAYLSHCQTEYTLVAYNKYDDIFDTNENLIEDSFITGQALLGHIIENKLLEANLDILLRIDRYIELYVNDLAEIVLLSQFGHRHREKYFLELQLFFQQFILHAAQAAHHMFNQPVILQKKESLLDVKNSCMPIAEQELPEESDEDDDVHESDDDEDDENGDEDDENDAEADDFGDDDFGDDDGEDEDGFGAGDDDSEDEEVDDYGLCLF
jgi:hypothetical protein